MMEPRNEASDEDLATLRASVSPLPPLPDGVSSAARAFHLHAEAEYERRRSTDPDFHSDRFVRAVSLALGRLGVPQTPRRLTRTEPSS